MLGVRAIMGTELSCDHGMVVTRIIETRADAVEMVKSRTRQNLRANHSFFRVNPQGGKFQSGNLGQCVTGDLVMARNVREPIQRVNPQMWK